MWPFCGQWIRSVPPLSQHGEKSVGEENIDRDDRDRQLAHLTRERDELRFRLSLLDSLPLMQGRPRLDVPYEMLRGYLLLESDERFFTAVALQRHERFVHVWYTYLNLLREGILAIGDTLEAPDGSIRTQLALRFIAASGGTVKLILDAGLAGYYTQAYGLVRHLFETWLRLEYIRLRPDEAGKWFVQDDGSDPRPPNEGTIHGYIEKNATGSQKTVVTMVKKKISDLNAMAHPSPNTLQQTQGATENQFQVGANYDPDLSFSVLHEGASGLRFILTALDDVVPQPRAWNDQLQRTIDLQSEVLKWEQARLQTERDV